MALRKTSITLFSMIFIMLFTIGMQSAEGLILIGEPCTTFKDCTHSCAHGMIYYCSNGHCGCDNKEEAISKTATRVIRKLL
ncbi:hypothetical protein RND71_036703 [Anisodus tanguticus]|uniref:Uncharacterized protein n=1 Tax=Anisodus tanguticus TaxID=243964 RepID=A0AAE1R2C0_9SOLA|nr:hypothetical protein RND71_036701 [Anisodus tanguticus]KAK4343608.1 hypothetical protein RND71_036702 [Anisodus tanguticus]KAK4343609.1 hypothetical protein RND71_036703 [Anisodus tanguticus]